MSTIAEFVVMLVAVERVAFAIVSDVARVVALTHSAYTLTSACARQRRVVGRTAQTQTPFNLTHI